MSCWELLCGSAGQGPGIVTAAAWVAAVLWVLSLTREFSHALGSAPPPPEIAAAGEHKGVDCPPFLAKMKGGEIADMSPPCFEFLG